MRTGIIQGEGHCHWSSPGGRLYKFSPFYPYFFSLSLTFFSLTSPIEYLRYLCEIIMRYICLLLGYLGMDCLIKGIRLNRNEIYMHQNAVVYYDICTCSSRQVCVCAMVKLI